MKKRLIIIGIIIIAIGAVVWVVAASQKKAPVPTVKATRGDIMAQVLITGNTKPSNSVDLSFERTGKVSAVYVNVGDKVKAGQALVEVDKSDLMAQYNQAKAALDAAKANLAALEQGTRQEEINIEEAAVANAQVSVVNSENSLLNAIRNAYTASDDAARNKTDGMFSNPRTSNSHLLFDSTNAQYKLDLESKKIALEISLTAWKSQIDLLAPESDLIKAAADANSVVDAVKGFLDELAAALNAAILTTSIAQSDIDVWKANVSTAHSAVNTASTSLQTAISGLRVAKSNLIIEENNLALKKAGSTPEQIAASKAAVAQAAANVDAVNIMLGKTVLRSPIDGVITVQGAKLGQIVTVTTSAIANSSLISIISLKQLEIDANIPEVDIGSLKLGDPVSIAFDALPGETFNGSVMEIDPAETIIGGVVNYQIKVSLNSTDERIKSGLTANLTIKTAVKNNVILLPQYTIQQNNSGPFVRLVTGKTFKDVQVKLGIRSTDGNVEIVSGVAEGDEVQNVGLNP